MSTIINGTSSAITFPDSSVQNTSAIVSGYVPYANLPAGSVLQVVNMVNSSGTTTTSTSYVDTAITLSITPKFSTSKILVVVNLTGCKKANDNAYLQAQIVRNSTALIEFEREGGYDNTTGTNGFGATSSTYLDSPATTSATTYKIQIRVGNVGTVSISNSNAQSSLTLMEIAA